MTNATTTRKTPAKASPKPATKKSAAADTVPGLLRRNAVPIAGAIVAGAAAAAAIYFTRGTDDRPEGHPAPDLETVEHPGPDDRADPHFRPDMDAEMTAEDRAALATALAPQT